jgi:hypothetical protein
MIDPNSVHTVYRAKSLIGRLTGARFFWLLAILVAFILLTPAVPGLVELAWLRSIVLLGTLFLAVYASRGGRGRFSILLGLIAAFFSCIALRPLLEDWALKLLLMGVFLATIVYIIGCILLFVLDTGKIGTEHIYGAVCAYILIAMSYAAVYSMVEVVTPGSFQGLRKEERTWAQFLYYSFTTLSTVGYGDISAVTMRARSFSILEQITGTFYVAILIARLAGLYPAPAPAAAAAPGTATAEGPAKG